MQLVRIERVRRSVSNVAHGGSSYIMILTARLGMKFGIELGLIEKQTKLLKLLATLRPVMAM